jgi:hypothetical protein
MDNIHVHHEENMIVSLGGRLPANEQRHKVAGRGGRTKSAEVVAG